MITPRYCSDCEMSSWCEHTREACKYPEGRLHGIEYERPSPSSQISLLTRRIADADQVIAAFARACITGQSDFAFTMLESYRAKYPKGGE